LTDLMNRSMYNVSIYMRRQETNRRPTTKHVLITTPETEVLLLLLLLVVDVFAVVPTIASPTNRYSAATEGKSLAPISK